MNTALQSVRELDPEACRRARQARDPRFDGEFFVAVTSTGIYCRPVCPARLPAERNVRYFRLAAQAAQSGFRPCLRCRPETAPGSPAWLGSSATVQRALRLIQGGALDDGGSVAGLAARLGIGPRYLLKLFRRELGVSPSDVVQHQRLLLARHLIVESALPLTDIAFAAGFGSVRRFNSAVRASFGVAPGEMRRRRGTRSSGSTSSRGGGSDSGMALTLRYRPPYDWPGVLAFFARHAVAGLEAVEDGVYRRRLPEGGTLCVRDLPGAAALRVSFDLPRPRPLQPLVSGLRRMFDLDANPEAVAGALGADPLLAPLLARFPGLRCPGHFGVWEAAVRAVVGQQISTRAAARICAGFSARCGDGFPPAAALAALPDDAFPMPARRRETLRGLAQRHAAEGDDGLAGDALAALPGIGPWTCAMVDLRGRGLPDAFPATDLGVLQAWEKLGLSRRELTARAGHWSPFRGYAASLLWRSL